MARAGLNRKLGMSDKVPIHFQNFRIITGVDKGSQDISAVLKIL
jgi:hypothetical protein